MMLEYFPALERAFDYSKNKAALVLLSHYATPDSLRRIGISPACRMVEGSRLPE